VHPHRQAGSAPIIDDPSLIRRADPDRLSAALRDSRERTLRAFAAFERSSRATGLQTPYSTELNPPVWELGHVGWFQEYWIGRNPQRALGVRADPEAPRPPSRLPDADSLYDSSRVVHATRWQLALPDADGTREYLARTLEQTLGILERLDGRDREPLYFAWLALMHEDMHREAAAYMANALGIAFEAGRPRGEPQGHSPAGDVYIGAARLQAGSADGGFAFDNELEPHRIELPPFRIDRAPVDHHAFAAFVADGGYEQPRHWSAEGWAWRQRTQARWPRFWRPAAGGWERCWFGQWSPLEESSPAVNLSWYEADAWCRWAGRRLPTEFEWEAAALRPPDAPGAEPIRFGQVWEWTSSPFGPYPGFVPHPYRDYSVPWFGSRRVLRGASFATHPRLRHPRYRNFFTPERNDIFAGFRSCAMAA
jgi:iron(II)-dependent oxidoreductase